MLDDAALLTLEATLDVALYGVDATVVQAGIVDPVPARGFWIAQPQTDDVPNFEGSRRVLRRVLVLRKVGDREDGQPLTLPKGTAITAPLLNGGDVLAWRVEGPERIDETYHYTIVVQTEADS